MTGEIELQVLVRNDRGDRAAGAMSVVTGGVGM
jgi:hypothetical protein